MTKTKILQELILLYRSKLKYNFERSNRLDYGVQLGGGLQLGMGSSRLVIDVRYLYGLQDFDKDNNSVKVTNRGIALSAGLMLPF